MFKLGMKKVGAVAGAAIAVMALGACAQGGDRTDGAEGGPSELLPQEIRDRGELRFGSALNQTPWSFRDDDHEPTGIDVDLCNTIAERLGVESDWADLDFQGLIPGLQAGRFDASCAGIYITPEREDVVELIPYLQSGLSIMVNSGSDTGISEFDDLCGKSVSVLQGSSQEAAMKEQGEACEAAGEDGVTVASFDSQPMAIQELRNERVEAFAASDQLSGYYATQYDELEVVVDGINPVKVGIALPQGSDELLNAFETELAAMVEDGTYQEILDEWGVGNSALEASEFGTE